MDPDSIATFWSQNWWSGFAGFGQWIQAVFLVIAIFAACYFCFVALQYNIRVTYFPVQGDSNDKKATIGVPKKDRGRRVKVKGIEHFKLLFARKTLKDIPFDKQYSDGVFLLRKSRDEFEPIPRPTLGNPSVYINVVDSGLQLWAQLRGQSVRKRFVDEDLQRKQMFIMAGLIIGAMVFAGAVIWMSYATSNATLSKINNLAGPLQQIADRIGLGGG